MDKEQSVKAEIDSHLIGSIFQCKTYGRILSKSVALLQNAQHG